MISILKLEGRLEKARKREKFLRLKYNVLMLSKKVSWYQRFNVWPGRLISEIFSTKYTTLPHRSDYPSYATAQSWRWPPAQRSKRDRWSAYEILIPRYFI